MSEINKLPSDKELQELYETALLAGDEDTVRYINRCKDLKEMLNSGMVIDSRGNLSLKRIPIVQEDRPFISTQLREHDWVITPTCIIDGSQQEVLDRIDKVEIDDPIRGLGASAIGSFASNIIMQSADEYVERLVYEYSKTGRGMAPGSYFKTFYSDCISSESGTTKNLLLEIKASTLCKLLTDPSAYRDNTSSFRRALELGLGDTGEEGLTLMQMTYRAPQHREYWLQSRVLFMLKYSDFKENIHQIIDSLLASCNVRYFEEITFLFELYDQDNIANSLIEGVGITRIVFNIQTGKNGSTIQKVSAYNFYFEYLNDYISETLIFSQTSDEDSGSNSSINKQYPMVEDILEKSEEAIKQLREG